MYDQPRIMLSGICGIIAEQGNVRGYMTFRQMLPDVSRIQVMPLLEQYEHYGNNSRDRIRGVSPGTIELG